MNKPSLMEQRRGESYMESKVAISLDTTDLDEAIEKANRLVELLREATQIIDSLSSINSKVNADELAVLAGNHLTDLN